MSKISFDSPTHTKFYVSLISIFLLIFYSGCDGDRGPAGPEGPEGPPGAEILPVSFEFTANLTSQNGFEFLQDIPSEIEVFNSDVILVFVLEDVLENDTEVWRQLPITEFNERGTRLLTFDFTFADVRLFLDANYELGSADEFTDVLFRGVHVPADFVADIQASAEIENARTVEELELILETDIETIMRSDLRRSISFNP